MKLIRFLFSLVFMLAGAVAGNIVGDQLRSRATGKPNRINIKHTDNENEVNIAVEPVPGLLIPALLWGLISKPRWLGAFIGGAAAAGFMSDEQVQKVEELVKEKAGKLQKPKAEETPAAVE